MVAVMGHLQAQTITTSTTSITTCPAEIVISVNVTNCNGVGAISLALKFNTAFLTYSGYQNVNSALGTGLLLVNANGNKVFMSWASANPVNVGNGTLVQLRFNAIAGTSNLIWDTLTPGNCEYTNETGQILPSNYANSIVAIVPNTMNVSAGDDITIPPGGSAQLNGSVNGGSPPYTYLWTPASWLSNPSISNPQASPPNTVAYTFKVTDIYNCAAFDLVTVIVSIPTIRTWAGTIDDRWDLAGNWSPLGVPGALDDVVIPGTSPVMPVIKIMGLGCNSIIIQSEAILTIDAGFVFSVSGPVTIEWP